MNKYHIYEEIGGGKHSVVYKGRKKNTIDFVAIKSVEKCHKVLSRTHVVSMTLTASVLVSAG